MKIKEFIGSTVLDKNANVVGKVENVDFDTETGKIETISLTLQKNIFSRDEQSAKHSAPISRLVYANFIDVNDEQPMKVSSPMQLQPEMSEFLNE